MAILVVDDLPGNRMLLKHALETSGFDDIVLAASAKEAFGVLGLCDDGQVQEVREDIQLILMDIMLPGVDGVEACRRIKQSERHRGTPVIMVTAIEDMTPLRQAFGAGAIDYIRKPVSRIELEARVNSAFFMKKEMDARYKREQELLEITRLLKDTNQRLRHIAMRDPLTGLSNRAAVVDYLIREFQRSLRDQRALLVLMIDIDFFKKFNDNYGHPAGDRAIVEISRCLVNALSSPSHMVARYGGEEFIAVLPRSDFDVAEKVANSMLESVRREKILHEYSDIAEFVTVSVGSFSESPRLTDSFESMIENADKALYGAKRSGRNCHMAYLSEPVPGAASQSACDRK